MAGNEEDMKAEQEFLTDLGKANSVSLENDKNLMFLSKPISPELISS